MLGLISLFQRVLVPHNPLGVQVFRRVQLRRRLKYPSYRSSILAPQDSRRILAKFQCARIKVGRFFGLVGEERLGRYKDYLVQSQLIRIVSESWGTV
jgi:hypothetical protein